MLRMSIEEKMATRAKIEERMLARAKLAVFQSAQWLTAQDLKKRIDETSPEFERQLKQWVETKSVFFIAHEGRDLFPLYAFDEQNHFQPVIGLKDVVSLLSERKSGWGIAFWFTGNNGFLNAKRPQDVLKTNPQQVFLAAKEELAGVTHG
jgi:hypothetical protein